MKIQNQAISQLIGKPTQTPQLGRPQGSPLDRPKVSPGKFDELLSDRLKVSTHAATRMESRNIEMDASKWDRVMQGVDRAAQKGAKESLVLCDDVALVVSVKNRTVITAVEQAKLKENVFTNIDSAVIV
jgi:flagellar operon protein